MRLVAAFAVGMLALGAVAAGGLGWLLHKLDVDLAGDRLFAEHYLAEYNEHRSRP